MRRFCKLAELSLIRKSKSNVVKFLNCARSCYNRLNRAFSHRHKFVGSINAVYVSPSSGQRRNSILYICRVAPIVTKAKVANSTTHDSSS